MLIFFDGWKRSLSFSFALFLLGMVAHAQPQTNNWFFTNNGLSFASGDPMNIPGGQIIVMEGASAISDPNGNLLFYTDGITVWNKNHLIMQNGMGLAGGYGSSTQSCLIVPKSRDGKLFYIFTTDDEGGSRGFQYSEVDMSLAGGLGAVTTKNMPLVSPCSEKVTAIRHCNKKDYWVITHKYGTDEYYAYLATENGVDPNPVISRTGRFIPVTYATMAGAIKGSPDGKRIIAVHPTIGAELSDFNNQTGIISNTTEIFNNDNSHHYGAEFSADSRMLYLAIHGYWYQPDLMRYSGVFQFDLTQPTITDIINSKYEVFRFNPISELGSMTRGPNGKIYMAQFMKSYLSVISSPEIYGPGCAFTDRGLILPAPAKASLPNFLNDYTTSVDSFRTGNNGICINTPVSFSYTVTGDVTALLWDFGDPGSGVQNSSVIPDPSHTYTSQGSYMVKLIKYSPCGNDTLKKTIIVGDLQLDLGSDQLICAGTRYTINPVVNGATSLVWQDGSASATYSTSTPGLYWAQASNAANGCIRRDTIIITNKPLPVVDLGPDVNLCAGATLQLNAFNAGAQYHWQDNSTLSNYTVQSAGLYWVEADLAGCKKRDSVQVNGINKPVFTLGPDQYLCPGLTLKLDPGLNNVSYRWQDGSTNSTYQVQSSGWYYADITNQCGTARDSIEIFTGNCTVRLPSAFSPNHDGLNDRFEVLGTGLVTELDLKIFDRGGQLIYHTKDKGGYWNGEYKGVKLDAGVYVYLLKYKDSNSPGEKLMKGTVLLLR